MTRGRQPARDYPLVLWFVAAIAVAIVHRWVPESTWLMIHLIMLGAVSHSVMVWSAHFSRALLKTRYDDAARARENVRLVLLAVGAAAVFIGVPATWWPVTVAGAGAASLAVLWHGAVLWRDLRRCLPGRFRITIRYYLAAVIFLPVGAGFGAALAWGLNDAWHARLIVAHSLTMLLGWIGLTVVGTLITFWPTVLRTRMDPRADRFARQAFPVLTGAVVVLATGALTGAGPVTLTGLAVYAAGLAWVGRNFMVPLRAQAPRNFSSMSILMGAVWFAVAVLSTGYVVATMSGAELTNSYPTLAGIWVVGFALQLVTGALSYLLPTVVGGGPQVVRRTTAIFDRWASFRLVVINGGLVLFLLPTPSWVRVAVSALVMGALACFVPLMVGGIRRGLAVKRAVAGNLDFEAPPARPVFTSNGWVAGVVALALAVGVGAGIDRPGDTETVQAVPTGNTVEITVEARDMEFVPNSVQVQAGDRLVITLENHDPTTVHDLRIGDQQTARLSPGESEQLVLENVGATVEGWCAVVGHRQMGMTFTVEVEGGPAGADDDAPMDHGSMSPQASRVPLTDDALSTFVDPVLAPAPSETVHEIEIRVTEEPLEVAPGVWQRRWTFNGGSVGPALRGKVGDVFEVTFVNDGSMGHSIDFHASQVAPDGPMRTIAPGESLVYRFTAERAGIWMYHCGTPPMTGHIAAGMHGAVIIDPPELAEVDREYVLVQSEIYLDSPGSSPEEATDVDMDAALRGEYPDFMAFNGIAAQYTQHPLEAEVGENVRIWVLDAGPNRSSGFHVVGAQFHTVYHEGAYLLRDGVDAFGVTDGGSQALGLDASQGGFVEMTFPEAGHYTAVNHAMADAENGAIAVVKVTG